MNPVMSINKLNDELKSEPKSAVGKIVISSAELEHKVKALYLQHSPEDDSKKVSLRKALKKLVEVGVFPEEDAQQIFEATSIRNEAVHNTDKVDLSKVKKASEVILRIIGNIAVGF